MLTNTGIGHILYPLFPSAYTSSAQLMMNRPLVRPSSVLKYRKGRYKCESCPCTYKLFIWITTPKGRPIIFHTIFMSFYSAKKKLWIKIVFYTTLLFYTTTTTTRRRMKYLEALCVWLYIQRIQSLIFPPPPISLLYSHSLPVSLSISISLYDTPLSPRAEATTSTFIAENLAFMTPRFVFHARTHKETNSFFFFYCWTIQILCVSFDEA